MIRELLRSFRRTGRTQRVLDRAAARAGRQGYCFVVCADRNSVRSLAKRLAATGNHQLIRTKDTCKVYLDEGAGGQVSFHAVNDRNLDLSSGRMIGAHPSCGVVADHRAFESYVIERLDWLLREWETAHNPFFGEVER
jgi:hypothetical protein